MKKPRTGGAGLLGFHWGKPVMAWGNAITLLAYALTGSLCRLFCLIEGRSPSAIVRLRCQSYPAYPVDWATLRLDEFKSGVKYAEHGGGKQVRSKVTLKYHILNDSELSPLSSGHCGARVHI